MENTTWFYTEHKHNTKAVVLIAHGLNLRPSKMDSLSAFFTAKNCDVLRMAFDADPKKWRENFSISYSIALEHATVLNLPLYFVGYSLGALVGMHFIKKSEGHHQIKKCALLAPATHTRFYTKIPSFFGNFFPKLAIPSLNIKEYRSRSKTTLLEYKIMSELQAEIKNQEWSLPTIVVINPKDELVNGQKLTHFAHSQRECQIYTLTNQNSQHPRKVQHLIIDPSSLGTDEWEKMLNILSSHFAL